jgi:hypothetical protein
MIRPMEIAVIVFILLVGIGAVLFGADSRIDERARTRRYLG